MMSTLNNKLQLDDLLPKPDTEWVLLEKLGQGTFGEVFRVRHRNQENVHAAAKIVRTFATDIADEIQNEFQILKNLSIHPNLPKFIGIYCEHEDDDQQSEQDTHKIKLSSQNKNLKCLWFVMELCEYGTIVNLLNRIRENQSFETINQADILIYDFNQQLEKVTIYAIHSALEALQFLHSNGIMHRDVKGSHLLVTLTYGIKLIDFGVSGSFGTDEKQKRNSCVGTALFMAPEIIACQQQFDYEYDERCDIWSLGITAVELAEGQPPLSHIHPSKALFDIPRNPPPSLQNTSLWSNEFNNFISSCLIKDYEQRPTAKQLLTENTFVNVDNETLEYYRQLLKQLHETSKIVDHVTTTGDIGENNSNVFSKHVAYIKQNDSKLRVKDSSVFDEPKKTTHLSIPIDSIPHKDRTLRYNKQHNLSISFENDTENDNPWMSKQKNPNDIDNENDLAQLAYLDEQTLIQSLKRRFEKTLIYTYIGDILIVINPKQYLPIDTLYFQLKYSKQSYTQLLPHIYSIAKNVYNQMIVTGKSQCILISGESGSGKYFCSNQSKTHSAQSVLTELALLGYNDGNENRTLENRLIKMNLLLEAFGNAKTILNNNSSRFGKLLEIFFSPNGTIVGSKLSEFLLEKTRVIKHMTGERNFHIFYYLYEHFLSLKRHNEFENIFEIDSKNWKENLKQYSQFNREINYSYLGDCTNNKFDIETFLNIFKTFHELNFDADECSSILNILNGILYLGNIEFINKITDGNDTADKNHRGCQITHTSIQYVPFVSNLFSIEKNQLEHSLCESSLMTRGETVIKYNTCDEARQTRDSMAKALYSRLFDWIVYGMNRYFKNEVEKKHQSDIKYRSSFKNRTTSTSSSSIISKTIDYNKMMNNYDDFQKTFITDRKETNISQQHQHDEQQQWQTIAILDVFGFEEFVHNSYEQLCINIANEQLQYYFRQHIFQWELQEYENEGLINKHNNDGTDSMEQSEQSNNINFDQINFPDNRGILDMFLAKPIGLLALLDEESRFPQSNSQTLIEKWRQNLTSPYFSVSSTNTLKKGQRISTLQEQPLFIIKHYAGTIEYNAGSFLEKNRDYLPMEISELLITSENHLINLLFRSRLRKTGSISYTTSQKQEENKVFRTVNSKQMLINTQNRTQATVSTYFRYSLMELISRIAPAQPTFVRCLLPNREHSHSINNENDTTYVLFDEKVVLEQIQYSGIMETIQIRNHGYSHRIVFGEFIQLYAVLAYKFTTDYHTLPSNGQTCNEILKKLNFNHYAIGKTKVFLKFYHMERLISMYKHLISSIIFIQSHIRMKSTRKYYKQLIKEEIKSESERAALLLQASVRGWLTRRQINNKQQATQKATLLIQTYWRMWKAQTIYERLKLNRLNNHMHISYYMKQVELFGNELYLALISQPLTIQINKNQISLSIITKNDIKLNNEEKQQRPKKSNIVSRRRVTTSRYYDEIHKEYKKKQQHEQNVKRRSIIVNEQPQFVSIPKAPPYPPPEFFQTFTPKSEAVVNPFYKRQLSEPIAFSNPVEELKLILSRQTKPSHNDQTNTYLSLPRRSLSQQKFMMKDNSHPTTTDSALLAETNGADFPILKSSNNLESSYEHEYTVTDNNRSSDLLLTKKTYATSDSSSSTSSLKVGNIILAKTDVRNLKAGLRKTGYEPDINQTLRRKIPNETKQMDFRNVLRARQQKQSG